MDVRLHVKSVEFCYRWPDNTSTYMHELFVFVRACKHMRACSWNNVITLSKIKTSLIWNSVYWLENKNKSLGIFRWLLCAIENVVLTLYIIRPVCICNIACTHARVYTHKHKTLIDKYCCYGPVSYLVCLSYGILVVSCSKFHVSFSRMFVEIVFSNAPTNALVSLCYLMCNIHIMEVTEKCKLIYYQFVKINIC